MFPTRYSLVRFIACAAIGHWFNDCHNTIDAKSLSQVKYLLVVILELNSVSEV